jgi:predicted dithiol-disulfide oxidoreductase (DUF899 family)
VTRIVDYETWTEERLALLAEEKAFDNARDALSARRRDLPAVRVGKTYRFASETGERSLSDLFDGKRQLIVYHFMFGLDYAEGCPSCSFWIDNFDGIRVHLAARDIALVAVSKAPLDKLLAYRARMGWSVPWVSAAASDFNEDFHVSFGDATPERLYNFRPANWSGSEAPGISVFLKDDDGAVLHTYSTYARGLDMLNGAYHLMDLTPLGRNENGRGMAWLRRHDAYGEKADG